MSRKFKRFLSILMVVAMVIAMAAACGKKEEAAELEKKEDTKVEVEKETEPAEAEENAADEQQVDDVVDVAVPDENLGDEDIRELKVTIKDAVINEYIIPNGIAKETFSWPEGSSIAWEYCSQLTLNYAMNKFFGTDASIDPNFIPPSPEKEIIDAVYNGIIAWYESSGRDSYEQFEGMTAALQPCNEVISTINLVAAE